MEDLIKALETRKRYNEMPFDEFVLKLEKYVGYTFPQEDKDNFKYCGLLNHDFLTMYVDIEKQ